MVGVSLSTGVVPGMHTQENKGTADVRQVLLESTRRQMRDVRRIKLLQGMRVGGGWVGLTSSMPFRKPPGT